MEQDTTHQLSRHPAARLGLGREPTQPRARLVVNDETTAWEIYNDRALTTDRELIKDWNDSLNTLLIFAALFSAVLTAFIIESMKLIQEDFTETTRDALLVITRQLANNTVPPFNPKPFVAPDWGVRVNYYFFTAISCTLTAALSAVLALQWVGSYDAGLNQSSPEERALQRHLRYQGVEKWRMVQIIAFLPALIFIALFLFFTGLAEWMWNIHRGVAGVIMAGLVFGISFFLVTAIISMIDVGAPFRTPASRSLPALGAGIYCSLVSLVSGLTLQGLASAFRRIAGSTLEAISELRRSREQYPTVPSQLVTIGRYLISPRLPKSFEERERKLVHSISNIKPRALSWLANSVDVLPHTTGSFRCIIREILSLPSQQLAGPEIRQAPWESICKLLLTPYETRSLGGDFTDLESEDLSRTWQLSTLLDIPSVDYKYGIRRRNGSSASNRILCRIGLEARYAGIMFSPSELCAVIAGIGILPTNVIIARLSILYGRLKLLEPGDLHLHAIIKDHTGSHKSLADLLVLDLAAPNPPAATSDEIVNLILDSLAPRFLKASPPGDTALERYMHSVEVFSQGTEPDYGVHDAVITQVLGKMLSHVQKSDGSGGASTLQFILRLIRAKPIENHKAAIIAGIFRIFQHLRCELWTEGNRLITARIYASILPSPYYFTGASWAGWRVGFLTGLSALLAVEQWSTEALRSLIWEQVTMELKYYTPKPNLSIPQIRRLLAIQNPILQLYASIGTGSQWIYPSTVPGALLTQADGLMSHLDTWTLYQQSELEWSASELAFTRGVILADGEGLYYIYCRLINVQSLDNCAMSSSAWFSLLCQPVLGILLRYMQDTWMEDEPPLLLRICSYDWFFEEFRAAGGQEWLLSHYVRKEFALTLTCLALDVEEREEAMVGWIKCIYSLLARSQRIGRLRSPEMFTDAISRVRLVQERQRVPHSPPISTDVRSLTSTNQDDSHIYVRNWSDHKWQEWQELMSDVTDGLRRGYIRFGPPEMGSPRFTHDPDGACTRA